jgi:hypothetical protein
MRLTGQPLPGQPGNNQTGQEGETSQTPRTQRFATPQCSLEYLNYSRVQRLACPSGRIAHHALRDT